MLSNFARPSSSASQIVKQLKDQGEVIRGWLGVSVQEVTDEIAESMKMEKTQGAFVVDVSKNSPAEKAGIIPTDIITKFDDQEISDIKSLPKAVAKFPVGKVAKVIVLRRGKLKTIDVKITKMKEDEVKKIENKAADKKQKAKAQETLIGLGLVELDKKIKEDKKIESGILIAEVGNKSDAAEKGIMPGDIILSVNQIPVDSIKNFKEIIDEAKKNNKKIFLFLNRGSSNYAVGLAIK